MSTTCKNDKINEQMQVEAEKMEKAVQKKLKKAKA